MVSDCSKVKVYNLRRAVVLTTHLLLRVQRLTAGQARQPTTAGPKAQDHTILNTNPPHLLLDVQDLAVGRHPLHAARRQRAQQRRLACAVAPNQAVPAFGRGVRDYGMRACGLSTRAHPGHLGRSPST
jgi:hypothetical protein